jgi:hypothetical protein
VTPLFALWKPATQAAMAAVCALDPAPARVPESLAVDAGADELVPPAGEADAPPAAAEDETPAADDEGDALEPPLDDEHAARLSEAARATGTAARRMTVRRT